MYYPDEVVDQVRTANDIVDVIGQSVQLKKSGRDYIGLCPFHNEKTPSFSVSRIKQMFYCFGCHKGGNVITFVEEYDHLSFTEAVEALAGRAGIRLPEQEYSPQERRSRDEKEALLNVNRIAGAYYYYMLRTPEGKSGMDYLKGRRLTDETMKNFGLGYAGKHSDALYRYLKQKGISDDLLRQSGLMNVDERRGTMYDKFWNRVIFPIMDVNNRVIGFGGRLMGDGRPKYLNSPETKIFDKSRNLYALNAARRSRSGHAPGRLYQRGRLPRHCPDAAALRAYEALYGQRDSQLRFRQRGRFGGHAGDPHAPLRGNHAQNPESGAL